jgi:hypothetical protein
MQHDRIHRRRLRVASEATAPGPALEGAPRFRPKVVLMSLSSIPIEIPILWPRVVMVGPRPRVLLTLPLTVYIDKGRECATSTLTENVGYKVYMDSFFFFFLSIFI